MLQGGWQQFVGEKKCGERGVVCPWILAKTAAKQPKIIRFRIFKCLWNRLDEPDSTVPITLGSAPPLVVKIGIKKII